MTCPSHTQITNGRAEIQTQVGLTPVQIQKEDGDEQMEETGDSTGKLKNLSLVPEGAPEEF